MATKKSSKGRGAAKKSAGKKAGAKKSAGKKASAKKASAKKGGAGKAAAKKSAAKKSSKKMLFGVTETAAVCTLTAISAGALVRACAPGAAHIGVTLERAGLITQGQRDNFGDCVFQRVLAAGCLINRGDIPTDADTTLRDVVFAILETITT